MGGYLDYALSFLSGIGVTALVLGGAKWVTGLTVDKWLSNRFAKGLEAFKHEQQIEIERLKHSINAQMDRLTRGNQREFDVLPEAWSRLTHAHGVVAATTSRLQSYP